MPLECEDSGNYSDKRYRRLKVQLPAGMEVVKFVKQLNSLIRSKGICGRVTVTLDIDSDKPYVLVDGENRAWDGRHRSSGLY